MKNKINPLLCLFLLFIVGCSNVAEIEMGDYDVKGNIKIEGADTVHVSEIKIGDYAIKGNIKIEGADTVYDGLMTFYKDGVLTSAVNYEDGKINGEFVDYYSNGKEKQESQYSYGEKNGRSLKYDSLGNLTDSLNFFHDLPAGPQITYKGDSVSIYKFVSLEDWPLYTCTYENGRPVEKGHLLSFITHHVTVDNEDLLQLFIYIVDPPHKRLTYRIYDKDTLTNDSVLVKELSAKEDGFFQNSYMDFPKKDHKYYLRVEAYFPKQDSAVDNILSADPMNMSGSTSK